MICAFSRDTSVHITSGPIAVVPVLNDIFRRGWVKQQYPTSRIVLDSIYI